MSTDKLPEAVRERVRQALKAAYPGGCKMLSLGSDCPCILCDLDRIEEAAAQQERAEDTTVLCQRLRKLKRHRVHVEYSEPGNQLSEVRYVAMPPDPDGSWVGWNDLVAVLDASHPPPPTPEDR